MYITIPSHYLSVWGWFQTKDILSTEVFRKFWVEITESGTEFRIDVGKAEETAAFMTRTWVIGSEPLPWSDVRYVGFSSWRADYDPSFNEIKFINPSNILLIRSCSIAYCIISIMFRSPDQTRQIQSSAIFPHQDSQWRLSDHF